ncbi:MAG: FlgD immunoglobulin-like domain containing protein [Candidatus Latescibacter sp.]|nr:FlgD immunoglobulin-like domain containing protein [Candidatus Latescibacter sp.]
MNDEDATAEAPQVFTLKQNLPNPFNPATTIGFALRKSSQVSLKVYDLLGREVVTLANGEKSAGEHRVIWNGSDNSGKQVSSGVYLYRLIAGGREETRKMLLAR